MCLDLEEIIESLKENNVAVKNGGTSFPVEQLRDFTRQLSVKMPDTEKVTLLYSGALQPDGKGGFVPKDQNGLFAYQVAKKMAETNPNIGIVDKTPAMHLVSEDAFKDALDNTANQYGLDVYSIIYGSTSPDGTRNPDGIVDDISRRFVIENAHKPSQMLTPFARSDSVYVQSELPNMMRMDGGDIEGMPRSLLQNIHSSKTFSLADAQAAIAAFSLEQASTLRYSLDENGKLLDVDDSKFWRESTYAPDSAIRLEGNNIVAQPYLIKDLTFTQKTEVLKGIEVLDSMLPEKPKFDFLSSLGKNGGVVASVTVGTLSATFMLAAGGSKAEAAEIFYENAVPYGETQFDLMEGDIKAAARSATIETVSNIGSFGSALGGAAIGATIGSVVPGVGTVVGGVIGGVIGALSGGMGAGYLTAKVYDNFKSIKGGIIHISHDAANALKIAVHKTAGLGDTLNWNMSNNEPPINLTTVFNGLPNIITDNMPPEVQALIEVKANSILFEKQFEDLKEYGSLPIVAEYIKNNPIESEIVQTYENLTAIQPVHANYSTL
ncbi:MAG: hypothetical protein KAJ86_00525 [Alphaproteobacteria bacterium]|nr:hypothetical protein [Alphaproteobacteria bacterium]